MDSYDHQRTGSIAVVGMACRFPGAGNVEQYWWNLQNGIESITAFSPEELMAAGVDPERVKDPNYVRAAPLLKKSDWFDADFFEYSHREAELMDPSQRVILELAWHALEHAGYGGSSRIPAVGVFAGSGGIMNSYLLSNTHFHPILVGATAGMEHVGNDKDYLCTRVSHKLNLKGPSLTVQTACSTSLVAVHLACQSLLNMECDMALAGGVNIRIPQIAGYMIGECPMHSVDGHCRPFDREATGTVFGSGAGLVVLKPLRQAMADRDCIHGVIRGSAIHNDGGGKLSYWAASADGLAETVAEALAVAEVAPDTVELVESHGTGTRLGDPVEVQALTRVFREQTDRKGYCALGSVKANIGHLESASGVASLIKALLALKHRQIPSTLHFQDPNPMLDLAESPFFINRSIRKWESAVPYRRAIVNNMGIGGTNACVVLEESPEQPKGSAAPRSLGLLTLSAKTETALEEQASRYERFLADPPGGACWADICYTANTGRDHFAYRLAVTADASEEARKRLAEYTDTGAAEGIRKGRVSGGGGGGSRISETESPDALADAYVRGMSVDWERVYRGGENRRVPLPGYPFEGRRFWVSETAWRPRSRSGSETFSLADQRVAAAGPESAAVRETVIRRDDPLLSHHRVRHRPVLPAAAYLEIASAAAAEAKRSHALTLRQVVWQKPMIPSVEELTVRLTLDERQKTRFAFRVESVGKAGKALHCTGEIHLDPAPVPAEKVPLSILRRRLPHELDGNRLYDRFSESGLQYGRRYRGVRWFRSDGTEALGRIESMETAGVGPDAHPLNPATMDAVLQVAAAMDFPVAPSETGPRQLLMPFSAEAIEVKDSLPSVAYAHVERTGLHRFHIRVCDESGRIRTIIRDLAFRPLPDHRVSGLYAPVWTRRLPAEAPGPGPIETAAGFSQSVLIFYTPDGERLAQNLVSIYPKGTAFRIRLGADDRRISESRREIRSGSVEALSDCLQSFEGVRDIVFLGAVQERATPTDDPKRLETRHPQGLLSFFRLVKALIETDRLDAVRLTLITSQACRVHPKDRVRPFGAGLVGLARVLGMEYPDRPIRCMDIDADALSPDSGTPAPERRLEPLRTEPFARGRIVPVAFRKGIRYEPSIHPLRTQDRRRLLSPFREKGVYLIVGGCGGIGLELADHLAETVGARLVLVGRRSRDAAVENALARIRTKGGEALYVQADVTDPEQMRSAVSETRSRFGGIQGAFHSAVVLRDRTLSRMDEAELLDVLHPKVAGSVVLFETLKEEPLDFLTLFSSAQTFYINAGQGNYTAACAFQDAFGLRCSQRAGFPVTVVNWGFWGTVGVVATEAYNRIMTDKGFRSIEPAQGMAALEQALHLPADQIMPLNAEPELLAEMRIEEDAELWVYGGRIPPVSRRTFSAVGFDPLERKGARPALDGLDRVNRYGCRLLAEALERMGVSPAPDPRPEPETLIRRIGIAQEHRRLFEALLDIPMTEPVEESLESERRLLIRDHPEFESHVRLLDTCFEDYPALLDGSRDPLAVLFPGGSKSLVASIYQGSPIVDTCNRITASVVQAYVEHRLRRDSEADITLLEIGAGTGGTSEVVLQAVAGYARNLRYLYTDVSKSFTEHGRERLGRRYPFISCVPLDIEQNPLAQGFEADSVDMVFGANVVHATRRISGTLHRIKRLLKANGLFILNEVNHLETFNTLTFGLTEGWWRFEDNDIRIPHSPLLTADGWEAELAASGFQVVKRYPYPPNASGKPRQCVLVGQSDGQVVCRQQEKAGPGKTAAAASAVPAAETRPVPEGGVLRKHAEDYLRKAIGGVLKRPASAIDVDTTFERYGIDSLLILEINKRFEADFGNLPTTLLFENRTVRRLADYFLSRHRERLNAMVGAAPRHASGQPPPEMSTLEDTDPEPDKPHPLATPRPTPGVRVTAPAPDIAVIGMSGRYPMAETLDVFWENLKNGRNCVQEIPAERWDWRRHFDPSAFGKRRGIYSKWGGFITDVDKFDAPFFRISPREAKAMDPQERLFMECAWSVFEDAGYTRDAMEAERIGGEVGVFVGVMNGDYEWMSGALGTAVDAVDPHLAYWSIANRISYHMNFQGPSIAVDTACSASLTAVHLACESLRKGECRMALAGGVNLILHPRHYERLCRLQMLSKEGQCRSFGAGADGFVDGEGVGAVLLKPLDRAIADADSICGVILGSAMNSGGKTSGYTVPNPNAQARLIQKALKQAGVKPETVSYVEAHGTGTALGDPVEVGGLSQAFGAHTTQTAYCAIGSVKSNIGHLESAAGIAGLTKVMLQLKHRQLVPSIHSDPPNPHIDFDHSPFYVQKTLTNWDADGPRRAAVSSFGAGGANVHMVVEEYNGGEAPAAEDQERGGEGGPRLFVLSAKDEDRLREYAQNLVRFLDAALKTDPPPFRLDDVAYTFQIGREAMEARLAVAADDLQGIRTGLESYLNGEERPDHLHVGTADKRSLNPDLLTGGRVGQTFVRMLLEERDLDRVAQLWTLGLDFDWSQWYRQGRPMRISAPTYPFARNRYWLSRAPFAPEGSERGIAPFLDRVHPGFSVDRGVWFEKSLDPDHPLIRDHAVDHRRILPGSVCLEMACEAARSIRPNARFRLARGVWPRALVFGDQREDVLIQITESPSAGYRYAVRQGRGDASVIYAQGEIRFDGPSLPSLPQLPIGEIQARCSAEMTGDDFYRAIQEADIRYGPHFQGISTLWTNPDEALGRISLPEGQQRDKPSSVLHPVFVDNAFQVVAGLLMSEPSSFPGPVMPFSVDEVAVFRRVPTTGYAHVKKLGPLRFNLWITDDSGTVCATIREVNLRVSTPKASPFLYRPVWHPGPPTETPPPPDAEGSAPGRKPVLVLYPESRSWLLPGIERRNPAARVFNIRLGRESKRLSDAHWSVDGSDPDALAACLKEVEPPGRVYHLGGLACGAEGVGEAGESADREQVGLLSLFRAVKTLQDRGVADSPVEWRIFTADAHDPFHRGKVDPFSAAIHGFARAVANEHPKWRVSCTDVDAADIPASASGDGELFRFWEDTDTVSAGNGFTTRAIRNGRIHVRRFEPIRPSADTRGLLKPNGVYLIVGGAGRIGRVLSDHLARAVKARLVWIGRRQVNADIREEMARIEAAGGRVRYVQADVTEHESLRDAVSRSKAHYGGLQGAFHCGMEENVQLIRDMDETAFRAVLAPKIRGSLTLYRVLASETLDFLIFFSSVQALIGDRGVGPYAAGCSFQDGFSQNRRPSGAFPVISIDWGYWKTALDEQPIERKGLIRSLGFHAIEDDQGADAVQRILSLGHPQVLAVKAADRLLERLHADTGVYWQSFPTLFPSILSETAGHAMVSPPGSGDREKMRQAFETLNALGAKRLFHVLHEMGAFPPPDTWVEVSELKAHLGIVPKYNRLVDTFIDILTRCGRIRREEDRLTVVVPVEATDRAIPDREVPEIADHVRLLETCLNRYPEILQGAVPAVEVMFPNASSDLIKGTYSGNPAADHYNRWVAAAVDSFIQARKRHLRPNERIRILEVGAGTGGTTAAVLPVVQSAGAPVDYDYTDISKGLLRTGRQRFGHLYPFVRFRTFDVETDVRLQGFAPGGYDLVLAANVLHATKNMTQTLENAKRLLKTHGLLVCNELTQAPTHILLTFGLLDGWWAFEDEAIRLPGSPLLSTQQWQTLLERTGFTPVRLPDSPVTWDPESSQEIILAESNGEARWNEKASRTSGPLPARPSKPVRHRKAFPDRPFPKTADGRQTVVRDRLMQSLSQVLDIETHEFDPEAAFTDFGVDSILSVEIINLLNDALSIRLRTTDLFNYPNIRELTDHILKTFGDRIPDPSETTDVQEPAPPGRLSGQDTDGQAGMLEILRAVHSGTMDLEEADQLLEAMNEN